MGKQYITRIHEMDVGHRVLHERMKCYSIHGHRVRLELTFSFEQIQEIGYCIDFKEIKRVGCQWLDDFMDHGFITNPHDTIMIEASKETNSKYYLMSLNGPNEYCNPTAENISKEIFLIMETLFRDYPGLEIDHIRFYETPNNWVDTYKDSIHANERQNFLALREIEVLKYAEDKGMIEYDSRKHRE